MDPKPNNPQDPQGKRRPPMPMRALLAWFLAIPTIRTLYLSFMDANSRNFVGLENYIFAFTDRILEPTPDKITDRGMARTFQNIRLWKTQTVFDNVLIAKHMRRSSGFFSATFRGNRKEEAKQREEVLELLRLHTQLIFQP